MNISTKHKKSITDLKIEQFCRSTKELLTKIQEAHAAAAKDKRDKIGRQ